MDKNKFDSKLKITGKSSGELITDLSLDGLKLSTTCPKCKKKLIFDDYLENPKINKQEELYFYCDNCDISVIEYIKISLEISSASSYMKIENNF